MAQRPENAHLNGVNPESRKVMPDSITDNTNAQKTKTTRQWTLSSDYTKELTVPIDTGYTLFNHSRKTDKISDFNIYPGNYGQPVYQLDFFDRVWQPDQFLYSHYKPYMFTPYNPVFVNTQVPFTEFLFTYSGKTTNAEQTFHLRHSQNVNKDLNFGLIYDIVYNLGQYKNQPAKNKTFIFHSSYNGEKYTAYFTAGINNLKTYENGGVEYGTDLENVKPENVPINLETNGAYSFLKNRHIMLIQKFSPGTGRDTTSTNFIKSNPVTFSLISFYEWNKRRYYDSEPESGFYDTIFIDRRSTSDSLFQGLLSNTFRIDFSAGGSGKFRIGAGAGIRSELRSFGQIFPGDTVNPFVYSGYIATKTGPRSFIEPGDTILDPATAITKKSSLVLTGRIFNNIGEKFGWEAKGDLWLQGYRAGDFVVDGRIFKDFTTSRGNITWDATGTMASYTPSFWYSSWSSNNILRKFDTAKEFRLMGGSSISYPAFRMSVKFNYALIDNFIYFGRDANPAQHAGGLSIASLSVKKEFVVWKLHWDNTILLQQTSNSEILSLPLGAARSSFFFDHKFRFRRTNGSFDMQLGAEAFYHTPYYASAYMPASGDYYNQNTEEIGNYPFVNAFLNLKLKRTRFFIMFDHLNYSYSGYDYFLIPDYPMNIRMLRYGIAWTFYN